MLAALLILGSAPLSFAQTKEALAAYRAKYPGQHIVFTKKLTRITIKMVKDVPVVTHTTNYEHLVLDKNGVISLGDETVDFSSFEKVGEIEAYSLIPTEKSSKKVPATNFVTRDAEAEGSVFHDDSKETAFLYPNLCEGALRVLNFDVTMTDYHFPFGFSFNGFIPVENATFIIECDTAVHLMTKLFNVNSSDIQYTEKTEKNKRIHTWIMPAPPMMKEDDSAPSYRHYSPHILAQIDYFNTKKGRVNSIGSPEDLHVYYRKNVEEVESEEPSAEIRSIAESVTKDLTSELDKVKAIYYWVQDNIKYIAFEEGMGGYVPRQPSKVIGKRYGDCKDMASLIYSMLKSIQIPAYLTWIGTRELPYKYTDFPSSFCDNHMIAVYKHDGKYYFLDATNSFQPLDMPTGFIQGKQAMMHISPDDFELVDVPVAVAEQTFMTDTAYISLDGRSIFGRGHLIIGGYYHSWIGTYLKDVPEKDMDKAVTSLSEKGNNSYAVANARLKNLNERDVPLEINYDFKVNNYATAYNDEVYVNLILEKDNVKYGEMKKDRIAPFEMENKSIDSYTVVLAVPEGYTVKSIPKNVSHKTDFLEYSVEYVQKGNQISMTLKLKLDFLMLTPEQFDTWNTFIRIQKASLSESVVLIKQ